MITGLMIQQFGPFRGREELRLANQGLVLVRGRNLLSQSCDANGVGKTSIAHAICWALFGVDLAGRKADAVACRFTDGTCAVRVDLEDALGPWSVLRTRRPAGLMLSGVPGVAEGEDMTTLQVKLEARLGVGLRTFRNAVVFGQGAFDRYVLADQAEQMKMLDEIQGIDFREALQKTKDWRSQLEEKLRVCSEAVGKARSAAAEAGASIRSLEAARDGFEKRKADKILDLRDAAIAAAAFVESVRARAAVDREAFERSRALRIEEAEVRRNSVASAIRLLDEEEALVAVRATEASGVRLEVRGLEESAVLVDALLKDWQEAKRAATTAGEKLEELSSSLDDLLGRGACPTCRQKVGSRRKQVQGLFEGDLERLRDAAAQATVAEAASRAAYEERKTAHEASLAGLYSRVPAEHRGAGFARYLAWLEIPARKEAVGRRTKQREEALAAQKTAEAQGLEEASAVWPGAPAAAEAERAALNRLEQSRRDLAAEELLVWDGAEALSSAVGRLASAEVRAAVEDRRAEKLRGVLPLADYWAEAFGDRGIRSFLVDGVAEFVNERLAYHLERLSCGEATVRMSAQTALKSGKTKESISFATEWAWGGAGEDDGSGGQDRRRDLAVFAAIQDLAEQRSARPFPLKVWDEPGDHLDARGQELFLRWVEVEARRRGTGLLITHSEGIASQADPDVVWTVVLGRDGARVEVG